MALIGGAPIGRPIGDFLIELSEKFGLRLREYRFYVGPYGKSANRVGDPG